MKIIFSQLLFFEFDFFPHDHMIMTAVEVQAFILSVECLLEVQVFSDFCDSKHHPGFGNERSLTHSHYVATMLHRSLGALTYQEY